LKQISAEFLSILEIYYCNHPIESTSYLLLHISNKSDRDIRKKINKTDANTTQNKPEEDKKKAFIPFFIT